MDGDLRVVTARAMLVRAEAAAAAHAALCPGLRRRFLASCADTAALWASTCAQLQDAGRACVREARSSVAALEKEFDGDAEAEKVSGEQLSSASAWIEAAITRGDVLAAEACGELVTPLLTPRGDDDECVAPPTRFPSFPLPDLWALRDGLDPGACTVTGAGVDIHVPDAPNELCVCVVDAEGQRVACVEEGDVCVLVEGGTVVYVRAAGPGSVEAAYTVNYPLRMEPVFLTVTVFGVPVRPSPWSVPAGVLWSSPILQHVPGDTRTEFLRLLASEWLPRCRYESLYVGSRDGLTARSFHSCCDGRGPTLLLVRTDTGHVCGAYVSTSWASPPSEMCPVCPHAFMFSVVGPHAGITLFPPKPGGGSVHVAHWTGYGPVIGQNAGVRDLLIGSISGSGGAQFDHKAYAALGNELQDPLGKGKASLTNTANFVPVEMEVYRVIHDASV